MRWFFKTTEPLPIIYPWNHPIKIDGKRSYVSHAQGGINETSGYVFINYTFTSMWDPMFWEMHFHEFLHRIIWLLHWKKGHDILDFFNKLLLMPMVNKETIKRRRGLGGTP